MERLLLIVDRISARISRWAEYACAGLMWAVILLAVATLTHPNSNKILKCLDQAVSEFGRMPGTDPMSKVQSSLDELAASVQQLVEERAADKESPKPYDAKTDELGASIRQMNEEYDELESQKRYHDAMGNHVHRLGESAVERALRAATRYQWK